MGACAAIGAAGGVLLLGPFGIAAALIAGVGYGALGGIVAASDYEFGDTVYHAGEDALDATEKRIGQKLPSFEITEGGEVIEIPLTRGSRRKETCKDAFEATV